MRVANSHSIFIRGDSNNEEIQRSATTASVCIFSSDRVKSRRREAIAYTAPLNDWAKSMSKATSPAFGDVINWAFLFILFITGK